MDANELGRWTRFAAKGGIGKCVAVQDCIAEEDEDLMFLKDDEIIVLMQLPNHDDLYLGYCEGVVGRFRSANVQFLTKLKRPVMAKRSSRSLSRSSSRPSSSQGRDSLSAQPHRDSPSLPQAAGQISRRSSGAATDPNGVHGTMATRSSRSPSCSSSRPPSSQGRNSLSVLQHRDSPALPQTALYPSRADSGSSAAIPAMPLSPSPHPSQDHLRSVSHSSASTAIESTPHTPADFLSEGSNAAAVVTIVDSPTPEEDLTEEPKVAESLEDTTPLYADDTADDESSYLESEPGTGIRLSVASSEGEGVPAIGLSLLQDFVNGNVDDGASLRSFSQSISTVEEAEQPELPAPTHHRGVSGSSPRSSVYSVGSAHRELATEASSTSWTSHFTHPSIALSNMSSDYGGEEWDGASDIYDNYRYSRASMASKMSRRFSKGSVHTVASGLGLDAPPLPISDGHRPSLDSVRYGGAGRERLGSTATASSSVEDVRRTTQSPAGSPALENAKFTDPSTSGKRIPPPLDLVSSNHSRNESLTALAQASASPLLHSAFRSPLSSPEVASPNFSRKESSTSHAQIVSSASPLLHGTFRSPLSSPDVHSPNHLSPTSTTTPSTAPLFSSTPGGAASALRQRLEMGKTNAPSDANGTSLSLPEGDARGKARLSTQPIVVEDDESIPENQLSPSPSTTSFSALEEKKRMVETTYVVVNQAPPPPYTPMSPTEPTSSTAIPRQPEEQQSGSAGTDHLDPNPVSSPRSTSFARQSMFLPHPHAPKPAAVPSGPMYGRSPIVMEQQQYYATGPPPGSVFHTLHIALNAARGDPYRPRLVTIYGNFERELASSMGPVPVTFSMEPQNNVPAHHPKPAFEPSESGSGNGDGVEGMEGGGVVGVAESSKTIPRPNFFPQAPSIRPRSRSFSEFDTPESSKSSSPEPQSQPANSTVGRSKSAVAPSPPGPATARPPQHKPSPLSIPSNNVVAAMDSARTARASPLSQQPPLTPLHGRSPLSPLSPQAQELSRTVQLQSHSGDQSSLPLDAQPIRSPVSRTVSLATSPTSPHAPPSPLKTIPARQVLRHSRSSTLSNRRSGDQDRSPSRSSSSMQGSRRSGESDSQVTRNSAASPTTLGSTSSLRSKLSLPALKIKGHERGFPPSIDEKSPTLSVTPSESFSLAISEQPTVHVKDMDFEIVTPAQQLVVVNGDGEDIGSPLPSPSRLEPGGSVRSSSPAVSTGSGTSTRMGGQPLIPVPSPPQAQLTSSPPSSKVTDSQDVEAHRQRELRWITAMASTSPSAARKSKKIRKLLYEGVPASVRYLVWAHLADSKAKRMDGVYTKLMMRERVSMMGAIERDVRRVFNDEGQLLDGSLVNVLQAYLVMVPDTQYSRGLTVIAGRLLMQAPEEDAFWTFVSMMETHLRPWFSTSSVMLDVDATLFGKAVEAMDGAVAKKAFVDLDIPPISLVRPWFTALFLEALPFDHSQRVWDIFLFEGIPFLYRVGLAVIQCCKTQIQQGSSNRDTVLRTLLHPPASLLPSSPDAFLEMAAAVKLKDDDVRKQRGKLEAGQMKKLIQGRGGVGGSEVRSLRPSISSISLPRSNSSRTDVRVESMA